MNPEDDLPMRKSDLYQPDISENKFQNFLAVGQPNEPAFSVSNWSGLPSSKGLMSRRQSVGLGPPATNSSFAEDIRKVSRRHTFMPVASHRQVVQFTQD
jgi:ABC-type multidrug transport system fused ATPase/permease subunit